MKSYCVREKIKTDSVPGSEKYVRTKNNRLMLKSKCASCGNTKSRFVSEKRGRGVGESINDQIGNKIPGFKPAQSMASALMSVTGGDKDLFKKYWSCRIAKSAFSGPNSIWTKKFWTHPKNTTGPCNRVVYKNGKWHNMYCD